MMIKLREVICAVCGKSSEHEIIVRTSSYGAPDLDGRPHGFARGSLRFLVQECPYCGYVNRSLDIAPLFPISLEWMKQDQYLLCEGICFHNDLAKLFYRQYLINQESKIRYQALASIHCAAWACDDNMELENAKKCRLIAASIAKGLLCPKGDQNHILLCCDLMRRSELFDQVIDILDEASFSDNTIKYNPLLAFERKHAKMKDPDRYTVTDAMTEMQGI